MTPLIILVLAIAAIGYLTLPHEHEKKPTKEDDMK